MRSAATVRQRQIIAANFSFNFFGKVAVKDRRAAASGLPQTHPSWLLYVAIK